MSQTIKGLPASTGVAIGPVWIYRPVHIEVERHKISSPDAEWQRLGAALTQAGEQMQALYQRTLDNIGEEEAAIFEAHQLVLQDPELLDQVQALIENQHLNAEAAVSDVVEGYAEGLLALRDEYFRARAQDVRDVGRRILYCLKGIRPEDIALPTHPVVIVAEDLTPSDTVQFDKSILLGFCTVRGGPTSHTAIIARSIGVPAVVSAPVPIEKLENGASVVLDGTAGMLLIDPSEAELAQAALRQSSDTAEWEILLAAAHKPAVTQDGVRVEVVANIGSVGDAQNAILNGAEGVGLLRTEFLYLDRDAMPDEDEQVEMYRAIFEVLKPWPVVVRTLDIGGDKRVSYLGIQEEPNPFLGWRAIRMISERPDVLVGQFRALLRAGVETNLRIMLPMVSSVNEVRQAKTLLAEAIQGLETAGVPYLKEFQFGIMVEVPSTALLADHLADEVDFFSIGTNDLTQYTLAVDRTNERVAPLASPLHPAVVQLIALTIRSAHKKGRWVGLCGELAGDPLAAPLLLGLGLDEFSMAAKSVPVVKQLLRGLSKSECEKIAEQVLTLATTQQVEELLRSVVKL